MVRIELTKNQELALRPLQSKVSTCSAAGGAPALLAQVFPLGGDAEVYFIDTNTAKEICNVLVENGYNR